jgi:hypothetical protein
MEEISRVPFDKGAECTVVAGIASYALIPLRYHF